MSNAGGNNEGPQSAWPLDPALPARAYGDGAQPLAQHSGQLSRYIDFVVAIRRQARWPCNRQDDSRRFIASHRASLSGLCRTRSALQIGRASCRERGERYGWFWVDAGTLE